MTTALAYVESAMSKIGMLAAGEVVSAEDFDVCMARMNTMFDAWETEGLYGFTVQETAFTLPANTASRTIGVGQQINMTFAAPITILQGSYANVSGIDYQISSIDNATYQQISQKTSITAVSPSILYFDGGWPTGNVFFWPLTATSATVHLFTANTKANVTSTTTVLDFPPGYDRAIENCLAVEIAPDFNTTASPFIQAAAANAKRSIRRTNNRTPQMNMPIAFGKGNSPSDFISGYYP